MFALNFYNSAEPQLTPHEYHNMQWFIHSELRSQTGIFVNKELLITQSKGWLITSLTVIKWTAEMCHCQ